MVADESTSAGRRTRGAGEGQSWQGRGACLRAFERRPNPAANAFRHIHASRPLLPPRSALEDRHRSLKLAWAVGTVPGGQTARGDVCSENGPLTTTGGPGAEDNDVGRWPVLFLSSAVCPQNAPRSVLAARLSLSSFSSVAFCHSRALLLSARTTRRPLITFFTWTNTPGRAQGCLAADHGRGRSRRRATLRTCASCSNHRSLRILGRPLQRLFLLSLGTLSRESGPSSKIWME